MAGHAQARVIFRDLNGTEVEILGATDDVSAAYERWRAEGGERPWHGNAYVLQERVIPGWEDVEPAAERSQDSGER